VVGSIPTSALKNINYDKYNSNLVIRWSNKISRSITKNEDGE